MTVNDDDDDDGYSTRRERVSLERMQAVTVTLLRQLAELLSACLFEETEAGVMPRSAAAQRVLGLSAARDIAEALGRATGLSPAGPSIGELIERMRAEGGAAGLLRAGSGQVAHVAIQRLPSGRHVALLVRSNGEKVAPTADAELVRELATANHEMANTVAAVDALAARALAGAPEEHAQSLRRIRAMIGHALDDSRATRQALVGSQPAVEMLDVNALLTELVETLEPLAARSSVQLTLRAQNVLRAELPRVPLRSVLFNLIKNGIEACTTGGRVSISASAQGGLVRFVIADDGVGMDETLRDRVFDPYFTTKDEGSGLGLALVQTLVGRMSGEILLETRPRSGSRFVISLPRGEFGRAAPNSGVRAKRVSDSETTQKIKIPSGGS